MSATEKTIHGDRKILSPSVFASQSLETDSEYKLVSIQREPHPVNDRPLQPDDDLGDAGSIGLQQPFAMADHKHPLPAQMGGATPSIGGSKGLVPAPSAGQQNYMLTGAGLWVNPNIPLSWPNAGLPPVDGGAPGNLYTYFARGDHQHDLEPVFNGASALTNGARGAVPQPLAGDQDDFLRGNGIWSRVSFQILEDTPSSYTGHAGKVLKVNSGETGLEFGTATLPEPATNVPLKPYADVGTLGAVTARYAREDHRHPLPDVMTGASSGASGTKGLVPQPTTGQQERFLSGAGVWRGQFTTSAMGLVPKPTANDVTNAYPLRASGGWAPISFFELNEMNETTLSGHAGHYLRVASDGSAIEFWNATSIATPAPTVGAPGSGFAQPGITQRFAREDHVHEMIVFGGPSTTGGVGAVPASTATDVSNGYFLRADGTWALPSGSPGGGTGIPDTTIQQKGDLIVGTGNATYGRLPVGTDGYILQANSTAPNAFGVEWVANPLRSPATTTPLSPTTSGTVGTSLLYARADHRHPLPDNYQGATQSAAGVHGLVPPALATQQNHLFTGGGTWVAPPITFAGPGTTGLVPNPGTGVTDKWLRSNAQWESLTLFSLIDAPNDASGYIGNEHKFIRVNDGTEGPFGYRLEFFELKARETAPLVNSGSGATGTDNGIYAPGDHVHPLEPVFTTNTRGNVPGPTAGQVSGGYILTASGWVEPSTIGGVDEFEDLTDTDFSAGSNPLADHIGKVLVIDNVGGSAKVTSVTSVPARYVEAESIPSSEYGSTNVNFSGSRLASGSETAWKNIALDFGQSTGDLKMQVESSEKGKYLVVGHLSFYTDTNSAYDDPLVVARIGAYTIADPASYYYSSGQFATASSPICISRITQVNSIVTIPLTGVLDISGISNTANVWLQMQAGQSGSGAAGGEVFSTTNGFNGLRVLNHSTFSLIRIG